MDLIGEKAGPLKRLSEEAGKDSELHRATDYYLDIVPPGLFPQEWGWKSRTKSLEFPVLERVELRVLELHDLNPEQSEALRREGSGRYTGPLRTQGIRD